MQSETIFVLSKSGKPLMPTHRCGRVRHLLKEKKARIYCRQPFTIQLLFDSDEYTQPIEVCMDAGYQHIGLSLKSEKHEYAACQYDLLSDEKERHDSCRKLRRTRRNRLRYRQPRFNNRVSTKKKGWLAPSLKHKADAHIALLKKYFEIAPITKAVIEVGQFDPALLRAMYTGEKIPEGTDYQHGELYYADSLRMAVFQRDNYTCRICGRSAIKDGVILREHHMLYWKGRHADTLRECMSVCTDCHTPANHQPNGILYGMDIKFPKLEGAAFMNSVRWYIINTLKEEYPDIEIQYTYGAITHRERINLQMEKSHINDAYCMGTYRPVRDCVEQYFQKLRHNNRILEKFYDAKYINIETGKKESGAALGCERTNRRESRHNEKNKRPQRGMKVSAGRRQIRKRHYVIRPHDIVMYNKRRYVVKGVQNGGTYVSLAGCKPVACSKVVLLQHAGGWAKVN